MIYAPKPIGGNLPSDLQWEVATRARQGHLREHKVANRTVANILKRNGITPNPSRKLGMSWSDFISSHQDVITACDFFTTKVLIRSINSHRINYFLRSFLYSNR